VWLAAGRIVDFRAPVGCSLARGTWRRSRVATNTATPSAVTSDNAGRDRKGLEDDRSRVDMARTAI
jgi:hypothetical protein